MPNTTMQMPWNEATGLRCVQALHASHEYHSKEWYDSVAILQDGVLSYAKLLLIFWAGNHQLAFVQWYKKRRSQDVLTKEGCTPLEWDLDHSGKHKCSVIDMSKILRREYVPRDFSSDPEQGRFHVSVFKWSRYLPDTRDLVTQYTDLGLMREDEMMEQEAQETQAGSDE